MKIFHYSLGFPPYRTGGLTKFCIDLIKTQAEMGHEAALLWSGRMKVFDKNISVKEGIENGIKSFEIINPLPVSLNGGICDARMYMNNGGEEFYLDFFKNHSPDVVHIHSLMGMHAGLVIAANKLNIRTVFTTHDFFPICSKVTMYRNGYVCDSVENCRFCRDCNSQGLSLSKIMIMQSTIYRKLKDSKLVKQIRAQKRMDILKDCEVNRSNDGKEFLALRQFYLNILERIDCVHFNSTVSREVYGRFISAVDTAVIPISHKDIKGIPKRKEFTDHIRFSYFGPQGGQRVFFNEGGA